MDMMGYILKKTYFKNKKWFSCGFWATKGYKAEGKNKNFEKKMVLSKIKIFSVQ